MWGIMNMEVKPTGFTEGVDMRKEMIIDGSKFLGLSYKVNDSII